VTVEVLKLVVLGWSVKKGATKDALKKMPEFRYAT
jgi:hypothetical protein